MAISLSFSGIRPSYMEIFPISVSASSSVPMLKLLSSPSASNIPGPVLQIPVFEKYGCSRSRNVTSRLPGSSTDDRIHSP